MTEHESRGVPAALYRRDDPGVDPPSIELGLSLDLQATDGEVVIFIDHDAGPTRTFELHRVRGAFRVSDGIAPPQGCFASAQAAIRHGWTMVDSAQPNPFDQFDDAALPPISALLGKPDPTGGAA